MRLSEEIRKIADDCDDSGDYCAFPHGMGCGCRSHCGCHDCIADAMRVMADKVEELERERSEDRGIAEWVRERGGIEIVKEQCKFSDDAASWIRRLAEYEDDEAVDIDAAMYGIERRLMPRGMEWPRFEDGEFVKIGDDVVGPDYGERINVHDITFHANGFTLRERTGFVHWYESDDRFKLPNPYPIGADGLPLKVGDKVFYIDNGEELTVTEYKNPWVRAIAQDETVDGYWPDSLTHTKPEPPDSWERLEEDAENLRQTIAEKFGDYIFDDSGNDSVQTRLIDIVRRAKELAEKERGE